MSAWNRKMLIVLFGILGIVTESGQCFSQEQAKSPRKDGRGRVKLALVAKSQNNLVFKAAYLGALHAAATLGDEYGVDVEILWRSPLVEDAAEQAKLFREATGGPDPVDGVALSVVSAEVMTPLIDAVVVRGVPVVTFDGDAPDSARFAYYGEDNVALGRTATRLLCERIGGEGVVAVLIANVLGQNARDRLLGMEEALADFPRIELWEGGLVNHKEDFFAGRAAMRDAHFRSSAIDGWVLLSSFPLFSEGGLDWAEELDPSRRPVIVAVDALPPQLPYLQRGDVEALVTQDCFGWGYQSVRLLLDAIVLNRMPATSRVVAAHETLDDANDAARWIRSWDGWLRRRPGQ